MNLGQITQKFYFLMGRPSTRRFTPADCAMLATQAQDRLTEDLGIPIGTLDPIALVAGQSSYQITEILQVRHAYISGPGTVGAPGTPMQELIPTDDFTLGGTVTQQWDNASGLVQGAPIQTPSYLVAQPQAYPVNSALTGRGSGPVAMNSPFGGPNDRPRYFHLDGYICIVPPPVSSGYSLIVNGIRRCPPLNISSDTSPLPYMCISALAWSMVMEANFSDDSSRAQTAQAAYENELGTRLIPWLRQYEAGKANGLVPVPQSSSRRGRDRWC